MKGWEERHLNRATVTQFNIVQSHSLYPYLGTVSPTYSESTVSILTTCCWGFEYKNLSISSLPTHSHGFFRDPLNTPESLLRISFWKSTTTSKAPAKIPLYFRVLLQRSMLNYCNKLGLVIWKSFENPLVMLAATLQGKVTICNWSTREMFHAIRGSGRIVGKRPAVFLCE